MTASYDLWSAATRTDPYPVYHRLRQGSPVHWDGQTWMLSRYDDVLAALQDQRLTVERMGMEFLPRRSGSNTCRSST